MRKPTAKTIIRKAYRMLTDENRWVKGAFGSAGREETGFYKHPVSEYSSSADCFCIMGALNRVSYENRCPSNAQLSAMSAVRTAINPADPTSSIAAFNDSPATRHRDVLKVLRRAYQLAGGSRP